MTPAEREQVRRLIDVEARRRSLRVDSLGRRCAPRLRGEAWLQDDSWAQWTPVRWAGPTGALDAR